MQKRIYEFEANDCRWPLGTNADGEQLFCCRAAPEGLPYCPTHGRMSTASGKEPSPMNPWGEPEFPRARRDHLDRSPAGREASEHEPDLVELLAQSESAPGYVPGLADRLRELAVQSKDGRVSSRTLSRMASK